jgi:thiamine-phosphate pyrophosphorylase
MIQYRNKGSDQAEMIKTSIAIKRSLGKRRIPFIVNDRVEIAAASGADGVHLGQGDIVISIARKVLGKEAIIGVSASRSVQAREAALGGADYLGIGPIFGTPLKPQKTPTGIGFLRSAARSGLPVIAIGGIDIRRAAVLAERGFRKIAVIRALCVPQDLSMVVRKLKKAIS